MRAKSGCKSINRLIILIRKEVWKVCSFQTSSFILEYVGRKALINSAFHTRTDIFMSCKRGGYDRHRINLYCIAASG